MPTKKATVPTEQNMSVMPAPGTYDAVKMQSVNPPAPTAPTVVKSAYLQNKTPPAPVATPVTTPAQAQATTTPTETPATQSGQPSTINFSQDKYNEQVAAQGKDKVDAALKQFKDGGGTVNMTPSAPGTELPNKPVLSTPVGGANGAPANSGTTPTATVVSQKDNHDGTWTNTLSDGTTSTVRYNKNTDGSFTATEVNNPVTPQNFDEAYNVLSNGGVLADTKENALYKTAYTKFSKFNALSPTELGTQMAMGEVSDAYQNMLQKYSPEKFNEAKQIENAAIITSDINTNAQNLYNLSTGAGINTPRKSDMILSEILSTITGTHEKYSDMVARAYADNPDIQKKADQLAINDDKIAGLDDAKSKLYEQMRTQFPDVQQGMLMGMVDKAAYNIDQQRNSLVRESTLLMAQYKDEKDRLDKGIEYDIKQTQREEDKRTNMMQFLYNTTRADEVRQEDYAIAEKRIASERNYNDAQKREANMTNIQNALASIGVTPQSGADYNTLLQQYAKGMKEKIAQDAALKQDKTVTGLKAGDYYIQDGELKQVPSNNYSSSGVTNISQVSNLFEGPMKDIFNAKAGDVIPTTNPAYAKLTSTGGMQCAEWVNRVMGTKMGSSLSDKLAVATDKNGGIGSAAVIDVGTPEGHVGIITEDLGDSWRVKSSNAHGDGRISEDIVKKSSVDGYYTSDKIKQAGQSNPVMAAWEALDKTGMTKDARQTNEEDLIRAVQTNNPEQARAKLVNLAVGMKGNIGDNVQWDYTVLGDLADINKTIEALHNKGIETGYFKGNYLDYINNLGQQGQKKGDAEITALATTLKDQLDVLIERKRTGAAISEGEKTLYNSIFPTTASGYELNLSKLDGLKSSTESRVKNGIDTIYGKGIYDKVWNNDSTANTQKQPTTEMDSYELLDTQKNINEALAQGHSKAEIFIDLKNQGIDPYMFQYK